MNLLAKLNKLQLTRVHLIRHGESEANVAGLVCGCMDSPLTPKGLNQAQSMKSSSIIAAIRTLPCLTSNLVRARKTAELLELTITRELTDLRETDTGKQSTWLQSDLCISHPEFLHHATDLDARYLKGETTNEMIARSWRTFVETSVELDVKELVIVAHGGPLNSIVSHLLGSSLAGFPKFLFEHVKVTSLSRIDQSHSAWRMERMNAP